MLGISVISFADLLGKIMILLNLGGNGILFTENLILQVMTSIIVFNIPLGSHPVVINLRTMNITVKKPQK